MPFDKGHAGNRQPPLVRIPGNRHAGAAEEYVQPVRRQPEIRYPLTPQVGDEDGFAGPGCEPAEYACVAHRVKPADGLSSHESHVLIFPGAPDYGPIRRSGIQRIQEKRRVKQVRALPDSYTRMLSGCKALPHRVPGVKERSEWTVRLRRIRGQAFSGPRIVPVRGNIEDDGIPLACQSDSRRKQRGGSQKELKEKESKEGFTPDANGGTGECRSLTHHGWFVRLGRRTRLVQRQYTNCIPLLMSAGACFERKFRRNRSRNLRALHVDVERVDGLAGNHEQPVPLGPAKWSAFVRRPCRRREQDERSHTVRDAKNRVS